MAFPIPEEAPVINITFGIGLRKAQRCGVVLSIPNRNDTLAHKKWQATYITPLRPRTLAAFPPWGIKQELVV